MSGNKDWNWNPKGNPLGKAIRDVMNGTAPPQTKWGLFGILGAPIAIAAVVLWLVFK